VLLIVLVAVIALTAVPAFTEDTHMPGVKDFTPGALFGEGTLLEFNRLTLVRVVMGVALCLTVGGAASRLKTVPGRGQALLEIIADFEAEYRFSEPGGQISEEAQLEFAEKVAFMALVPYLRESVHTTAMRLGGRPPLKKLGNAHFCACHLYD